MQIYQAIKEIDNIGDKARAPELREIGEMCVESIRTNIREGGRPEPFWPRADDAGVWPELYKTGKMYDGLRAELSEHMIDITTDTDYAEYLDEGTHKMIARPFLTIIDSDLDKIEEKLIDAFDL